MEASRAPLPYSYKKLTPQKTVKLDVTRPGHGTWNPGTHIQQGKTTGRVLAEGISKMMNFCVLCFECGIIGGGGREDSILIHKATSAVFLLEADIELGYVILPSSSKPENLKPGTY